MSNNQQDNYAKVENNQVTIVGEICSEFQYNHEVFGEKFYRVSVKVDRLSNNSDILPIIISERLTDLDDLAVGTYVMINGQFRSYNERTETRNRLRLSVFAKDVTIIYDEEYVPSNYIYLNGYICKEPKYRKTPLGREISDLLIAVNRSYGKSDYIPSICWGRNAKYASELQVGDGIEIEGRIQSREYTKKLDDKNTEKRTAYEVSINKMQLLSDSEEEYPKDEDYY